MEGEVGMELVGVFIGAGGNCQTIELLKGAAWNEQVRLRFKSPRRFRAWFYWLQLVIMEDENDRFTAALGASDDSSKMGTSDRGSLLEKPFCLGAMQEKLSSDIWPANILLDAGAKQPQANALGIEAKAEKSLRGGAEHGRGVLKTPSSLATPQDSPEPNTLHTSPRKSVEFAHQHQLLRDVSNGSCVSNRNSSENLQNLQNQGIRKGPYPFWSTDGEIEMDDIIDDGLPPDERAGMQRTLHVMLTVEVDNMRHLPKMNLDGECTPYVVLRYYEELFQTAHKDGLQSVFFGETFDFFVHAKERQEALASNTSNSIRTIGPCLHLECWNWHRIASATLIGTVEVPLKDIFARTYPLQMTYQIYDSDGLAVRDKNDDVTTLTLTYSASELHSDEPKWQAPSLMDTLNCSEGKCSLRRGYRSRAASCAQTTKDASRTSMSGSRYSTDRNSEADVYGASSALQVQDLADSEQTMAELIRSIHDSKQDVVYWRERLNTVMESLWVNLFIMVLVVLDCSSVIYFIVANADEVSSPIQADLTAFVLTCFVIELLLRMLAQQWRFWKNPWNLFDTLVILLSVILALTKYVMSKVPSEQDADVDSSYSTILRALSRTAMALRILRVIINLRKARKLSGNVTKELRNAVSQNRRRYQKLGFDLDLTYITSRIIAMSAPCFGQHSTYRNDIHIVARFLSLRHYSNFLVFNFCDTYSSSDGVTGNYHPQMLFNQVMRIPFEDHNPPLLTEIIHFCEEATRWLRQNPKNIIATHCKGGKGRTGVLCSVLLLWCGHRRCAMDAMELFTFRRSATYDEEKGFGEADDAGNNPTLWTILCGRRVTYNQGPEGPSQIRYVHYVEAMLYSGIDPLKQSKMVLLRLSLPTVLAHVKKPWKLYFTVSCERNLVFDSRHHCRRASGSSVVVLGSEPVGHVVSVDVNTVIWSDTRIDLFVKQKRLLKKFQNKEGGGKWKQAGFIVFNTAFYPGQTRLTFLKNKIDKICKNTSIPPEFELALDVTCDAEHPQLSAEAKFRRLFSEQGILETYRRDEIVLLERDKPDALLLVVQGSVQGVVHETYSRHYHPLGCVSPHPSRSRHRSGDMCRFPALTILGEGAVLGASQFLSGFGDMEFVARSDVVHVRVLRKSVHASQTHPPPATAVSPADSHCETPTQLEQMLPRFHGDEMVGRGMGHVPSINGPRPVTARDDSFKRRKSVEMRRASLDASWRSLSPDKTLRAHIRRALPTLTLPLLNEDLEGNESTGRRLKNILIEGVSEGIELCDFYRYLAVALASRLTTVQNEAMRLSLLKALNDQNHQYALGQEDELEKLKKSAISIFDLQVNEEMIYSCKATYLMRGRLHEEEEEQEQELEEEEQGSGTSSKKRRKVNKIRLITMSNHLILDPEIFGPTISSSASVIYCHQLRSMAYKSDTQQNTLVVTVQRDRVSGLDLCADVNEYEFTFHSLENVQQMSRHLAQLCQKADEARTRHRERPFESPHMRSLLDQCAKAHALKKHGVFKEGSQEKSLFILRSGCIKMKREGAVFRCIRAGECFGVANFVENTHPSRKFQCVASEKNTLVLELPHDSVKLAISHDHEHGILFYSTLCQILDLNYRETMEEMFPGSWSRNSNASPSLRENTFGNKSISTARSREGARVNLDISRRRTQMSDSSWHGGGKLGAQVATSAAASPCESPTARNAHMLQV